MKHLSNLLFFLFLCVFYSCSIDRSIEMINEEEKQMLATFFTLEKNTLIEPEEEGEKLLLCLYVKHKENGIALGGQDIHFYQAAADGNYHPRIANDESTARIANTFTTNEEGSLFIETILPGDYGSRPDNRHIHTSVFGAQPEAYDIHFKQYANPGLKRFIRNSDQHFLAELKYTEDSTLITFLTLEAKF